MRPAWLTRASCVPRWDCYDLWILRHNSTDPTGINSAGTITGVVGEREAMDSYASRTKEKRMSKETRISRSPFGGEEMVGASYRRRPLNSLLIAAKAI